MAYAKAPRRGTAFLALLAAATLSVPAFSQSNNVRITELSDVNFGLVSGPTDRRLSQNICVFAHTAADRYAVVASGSGASGSFELNSGLDTLPYEVQWSDSPNQTSGTTLVSGTTSQTFTSTAQHQLCKNGPVATASMTVLLRATEIDRATAGSYAGTLQIMIVPN